MQFIVLMLLLYVCLVQTVLAYAELELLAHAVLS
jgi:hypothetical protein